MKINMGIGPLLTIIFMILKLTGYIEWDWIWILSPIWIPLILFVGIALGIGLLKVFYLD